MSSVCVGLICLTKIALIDFDMDHIGHDLPKVAYSYDGVARNVSRFYKSQGKEYKLGLIFAFDSDTMITLNYDNGLKTEKMKIDKYTEIKLVQGVKVNNNLNLSFKTRIQIGGDISHTPCVDGFGRNYYCGSLTAWSDFDPVEITREYIGEVVFSYKF